MSYPSLFRKIPAGRISAGIIALLIVVVVQNAPAQTRTLRIVAYNIEADIGVTNKQSTFTNIMTSAAAGAPLPGLIAPPTNSTAVQAGGVLEGIGEEVVNGDAARPLDILALEETTSNPLTVTPIVNGLNAFYSFNGVAVVYTNSSYQATESGGDTGDGNGPNAIVYNTSTVQLLASVPVDPSGGTSKLGSSSGEYREVMRYEFAPAGITATTTNEFYIYVSHYKSGGSSDATPRGEEAQIVRADSATLPATARILYVGDFNTGTTSEAMYKTLIGTGINQAVDPLNPSGNTTLDFDDSSSSPYAYAQTDSSIYLEYRDDYEMMTTNVFYDYGNGLKLVPETYHPFGNNGTTAYKGTANASSNTSLTNLVTGAPISAAQLLIDLTGGSDHLPIYADYTIPMPSPVINNVSLAGTNLVFSAGNAATNGVYTLLTSTNLLTALTNWTPLATNISSGNSFTLTLTNGFNSSSSAHFFALSFK